MNERTMESDFGAAIAELSMEQLGIDADAAAHQCDKEVERGTGEQGLGRRRGVETRPLGRNAA